MSRLAGRFIIAHSVDAQTQRPRRAGRSGFYASRLANLDEAWLQVGFRRCAVRADVLEDPVEIRRTIEALRAESPADAQRLFGWDPQSDRLDAADFSPMIEHELFVRFTER